MRSARAIARSARRSGSSPACSASPQGLKTPAARRRRYGSTAWPRSAGRCAGWTTGSATRSGSRGASSSGAVDGGVLLLHDGGGFQGSADRSATLRALPLVIDGLRARGFTFVRVDQLFDVAAYQGRRRRRPGSTRPGAGWRAPAAAPEDRREPGRGGSRPEQRPGGAVRLRGWRRSGAAGGPSAPGWPSWCSGSARW